MGDIVHPVTKTIVTDTNAYATGDYVGTTILELANVGTADGAMLHSITLTDLDKQSQAIDFLFWKTACANTTFTNNAALDIHDTDLLQFAGHVSVLTTHYAALNDNSVATVSNIGLLIKPADATRSIYITPVIRGTATYSASGLQVTLNFVRP